MDRAGYSACRHRGMHLAAKATGFAAFVSFATPDTSAVAVLKLSRRKLLRRGIGVAIFLVERLIC
jgi:hypothetical protein